MEELKLNCILEKGDWMAFGTVGNNVEICIMENKERDEYNYVSLSNKDVIKLYQWIEEYLEEIDVKEVCCEKCGQVIE